MAKILVTGCKGQLGSEIQELEKEYAQYSFFFTDIHNLDLTDHKAVKIYLEDNDIDVIVNCAAYTAVDKAETEHELADALNYLAVKNLARIAKANDIKLIHISTDYVFDGTKDTLYTETDVPNPQSVYGLTKLKGEKAIQQINPANSIIIRTSWVYSSYGNNFVKTMLRLGKERDELNVVADQFGSPTYARDLAKAILEILPKIKNKKVEFFHYANAGSCSWYDFAKAIFKNKNLQVKLNPISTSQYPTPAKRPMYSVMDTVKIKERFKVEIPDWEEALIVCLQKI
jgi:dTDP-4-dehydrorhamnose reductase